MPISTWMDKQIVVNPNNGILFINLKYAIDTCNHMDGSQNNYVVWKKQTKKARTLWLYLYKCLINANQSIGIKSKSVFIWRWSRGLERWRNYKGSLENFRGDIHLPYDSWVYIYAKDYQTVHFMHSLLYAIICQ